MNYLKRNDCLDIGSIDQAFLEKKTLLLLDEFFQRRLIISRKI
jgi:hypothetical protein